MPTVSAFKRERVVQLQSQGVSQRKIAIELEISRCAVQKIIKKFRMGLGFQNTPRIGRPQKLTAASKRRIVIESRKIARKPQDSSETR